MVCIFLRGVGYAQLCPQQQMPFGFGCRTLMRWCGQGGHVLPKEGGGV
jgi:hypothetical protein